MGYTHYWHRRKEVPIEKMCAIVNDFGKIVLTLDSMGVRLADGMGKGAPTITEEDVCFNGLEDCGHSKNEEVSIPWPTQSASGVIQGRGRTAGNWFAGALLDARCCNGDCSYETFHFSRVLPDNSYVSDPKDPLPFFSCTKTAYRPYDLAVNAFLVIAKHHLGDDIRVASDGELAHWIEGIELCRVYLGYEETYEFSDGGLVAVAVPSAT